MPLTRIERVILVDAGDRDIGSEEKLAAHRSGALHRAFSVMIWDRFGRMLLQQRHIGKYHSGGLWTNACCGHQRPGEDLVFAANRRLKEEMGITCSLEQLGSMIYRADVDPGLVEHELVHVFRGRYDGTISPDPAECDGFTWEYPETIRAAPSAKYSVWFNKYLAAGWPVEPPSMPAAAAGV
jgi:isopentenyl-diphosphate delta-isomerase